MKLSTKIIISTVGFYCIGGHIIDYHIIKPVVASEARKYCDSVGKPLLNLACNKTSYGDVNCDISYQEVENFQICDATNLSQFKDKEFGAVFASHILEHLDDPNKALEEWNRVADKVYILTPSWFNMWAWAQPEHKWMFIGDEKIRIRE